MTISALIYILIDNPEIITESKIIPDNIQETTVLLYTIDESLPLNDLYEYPQIEKYNNEIEEINKELQEKLLKEHEINQNIGFFFIQGITVYYYSLLGINVLNFYMQGRPIFNNKLTINSICNTPKIISPYFLYLIPLFFPGIQFALFKSTLKLTNFSKTKTYFHYQYLFFEKLLNFSTGSKNNIVRSAVILGLIANKKYFNQIGKKFVTKYFLKHKK